MGPSSLAEVGIGSVFTCVSIKSPRDPLLICRLLPHDLPTEVKNSTYGVKLYCKGD